MSTQNITSFKTLQSLAEIPILFQLKKLYLKIRNLNFILRIYFHTAEFFFLRFILMILMVLNKSYYFKKSGKIIQLSQLFFLISILI